MNATLHQRSIVVDGLIIAKFGPDIFRAMKEGGITAANCTCSIWEGFEASMRAIAEWKGWFRTHADTIRQVYAVEDIHRCKHDGRVGIFLGWQNSTGFGDHLPNVRLFAELGLRVVQLTYNTANMAGSGCFESQDGGLTDFGRELVAEMNDAGILIDLSHVGARTTADTIAASRKPVIFSHCLPLGLKMHPRNKSDAQLKAMADSGGFIGVTAFPPFLRKGNDATVDDIVEAVDYIVDIAGEASVGIGTDFTQGHGPDFFEYINRDKGHFRALTEFPKIVMPRGFARIEDMPNLTAAFERHGWPAAKIEKIIGLNWLVALGRAWG